jgi:histidine ammonia-lyase
LIRIDDREVRLDEVAAVARGEKVELSTDARWVERLRRGREILDASLGEGQAVYGVSTNVGNRSSVAVGAPMLDAHAYQLILHHGCGVGDPLSEPEVRAATFVRLVSLAKGFSAVRLELLEALCRLLNAGVTPVVPRLGSVGASGDLTPLSYLAAVLVGEREATFRGEVLPAAEAMRRAGLEPFAFAHKETISLMNGTSAMTAIAVLAILRLAQTVTRAEQATALAGELLHARSQAFHPIAHQVKPHPGQIESAAAIRGAIEGSALIDQQREGRNIQDPYSLRCAPQVLGAARDSIAWCKQVLHREVNSVNDNPLVDPDTKTILFAGNFYGGHVALAMDLAKIAAASVADLADRQFALLVDSRFNLGLPETLVGYGGNGIKGMELTTTALTALAAQRCCSDTIQSRSTEVGNQDKVSMGMNAALNAADVVTLTQQALATHLIALSNAARLRDEGKLSAAGRALLGEIRERSPVLVEDRRLDCDIDRLTEFIDKMETPPAPMHQPASKSERPQRTPLSDREASFLVQDGDPWSGQRILALAHRISHVVPSGNVVGVSSASPAFVLASVLALWKLGRSPILLDPSLRSEPEAVFKRYAGMQVLTDAPNPVLSGGIVVAQEPGSELLEPLWPEPDHTAALFFTSGSTGEPKIIAKRASQLVRQMDAELRWLGIPENLSVYSLAPPFHILGFVYGLFLPLLAQGRAAFSPQALASQWVVNLRAQKPDLVVGVPFHYRTLASHAKSPLPDAFYFSSGAPLTPDIDAAFREKTGQKITQGYGSTETGGLAKREGFGAWRPFPGVEWRIAEDGRLVVRSPWQEDPEQWHLTDDVVSAEGDGFVLHGRADSVVKVAGKRFSTDEVVTASLSVAGVSEAAAVAYERFGEIAIALFVVGTVSASDLRDALNARLAPFKVPRFIEILADLPRLSNGKVDRQELKKLATRG